jgi:hypothetical protein
MNVGPYLKEYIEVEVIFDKKFENEYNKNFGDNYSESGSVAGMIKRTYEVIHMGSARTLLAKLKDMVGYEDATILD